MAIPDSYIQRKEILSNQVGVRPECGCHAKRSQLCTQVAGHGVTYENRLPLSVLLVDQCHYRKVSAEHQSCESDAHNVMTGHGDLTCEGVQPFSRCGASKIQSESGGLTD